MKITIENTTKMVELSNGGAGVPARVWEGTTEDGVPVYVYVTRISPQTEDVMALVTNATEPEEVLVRFSRELRLCRRPSPDVETIPLRLIV
jgi:hypothetical protein